MRIKLANNSRTLEIMFSASPTEAERVVSLTRARFREKLEVVSETRPSGAILVALTHRTWKPVPGYLKREIPSFMLGCLAGYKEGYKANKA